MVNDGHMRIWWYIPCNGDTPSRAANDVQGFESMMNNPHQYIGDLARLLSPHLQPGFPAKWGDLSGWNERERSSGPLHSYGLGLRILSNAKCAKNMGCLGARLAKKMRGAIERGHPVTPGFQADWQNNNREQSSVSSYVRT